MIVRAHFIARVAAAALLLLPAVTACDDASPEVEEPASAETCEGLVDIGDQLVRAYVQVLDQTDVGDLLAGPDDENLDELAGIGEELDMRASNLGCDVAGLNAAIAASTSDLEPTSPPVEMFLTVVREGVVGSPPVSTSAPVSTSTAAP